MILKQRSGQNEYVIEGRHFKVGMWGSFVVYIDLPKLENSEVTMEARLTNDPEIEVRTKPVSY